MPANQSAAELVWLVLSLVGVAVTLRMLLDGVLDILKLRGSNGLSWELAAGRLLGEVYRLSLQLISLFLAVLQSDTPNVPTSPPLSQHVGPLIEWLPRVFGITVAAGSWMLASAIMVFWSVERSFARGRAKRMLRDRERPSGP